MKVECPVCHREGVAEQRGGPVRIIHYDGWLESEHLKSIRFWEQMRTAWEQKSLIQVSLVKISAPR